MLYNLDALPFNYSTQRCDELIAKLGLMADAILVNGLVDLVRLLIFDPFKAGDNNP